MKHINCYFGHFLILVKNNPYQKGTVKHSLTICNLGERINFLNYWKIKGLFQKKEALKNQDCFKGDEKILKKISVQKLLLMQELSRFIFLGPFLMLLL